MNPKRRKVAILGNFGCENYGNEATLEAVFHNLRRLMPEAEYVCICTGPEAIAKTYNINVVPIDYARIKGRTARAPFYNVIRKLIIGIPSEIYRWQRCIRTLWNADSLVVPGTGLLTDAYGLFNWGPYGVFRWCVAAKLCRCKLFFLSVGAGPLYTRIGKVCIRAALTLADFRSYRDESSKRYLKGVGLHNDDDAVYPDLVFSLPSGLVKRNCEDRRQRPVVGVGLMEYAGRYSSDKPATAIKAAYLETLVEFVRWLLAQQYDIRLLVGDAMDTHVVRDFRSLLKERSVAYEQDRVVDEPVMSFSDVLSQIASTDVVLATRFHSIVFSLLLNKPVSAITFHHKCTSLMSQIGLAEYTQDINALAPDRLIEQFRQLLKASEEVKKDIAMKVNEFRASMDKQYDLIAQKLPPARAPEAPNWVSRQAL